MVLLIEYMNGRVEIVDVPENNFTGIDWRSYVIENFHGVKNAYCNLRESLYSNGNITKRSGEN